MKYLLKSIHKIQVVCLSKPVLKVPLNSFIDVKQDDIPMINGVLMSNC